MKRFALVIAIGLIALSGVPTGSYAQQLPPVTGMKPDRTTADPATRKAMQEKEAALRAKRADCRRQARAQKLSLLKRIDFVRECMKR
jgi:hypothetical protein